MYDVVIIGGGHNGLVAAAYLARAGQGVLVLERREHVGGAAVSERPWEGVDARLSRYSYLVSLLPHAIVEELGLPIELRRRRIAFHAPGAPVPGDGWERLSATCRTVARAVFPSLTEPLLSADDLRARIGDDAAWSALFERPIGELIEECLDDDTLRGVALTDALIGTFAGAHDADLRQNRCFLYHVLSTWDVPIGGMGVVTDALRDAAVAAGAELRCGAEATAVEPGAVRFADAAGGERVATAEHVLANVAPAVLDRLRGSSPDTAPEGAQLKVNFLLSRLPRLRDPAVSPEDAFAGTFHVNEGYAQLEAARGRAAAGELPEPIPCEVYCHSLTDPSILGPELRDAGAQTLTCFALQLPARLFAGDPDGTRDRALEATLASLDSVLGEPILDCAWVDPEGRPCIEAHTPSDLESELGLPGGNIFHRDLSWPFAEREEEVGTWGVETDDPGLLLCGAGARRGGGVSGVPGRNAAQAVLRSGA